MCYSQFRGLRAMLNTPPANDGSNQIGLGDMTDYLVAFGFVAMILAPSIVATFCASDRRLLGRSPSCNCPAVDRRHWR
jgi:hypothetical protein